MCELSETIGQVLSSIDALDPELAEELARVRGEAEWYPGFEQLALHVGRRGLVGREMAREAVVLSRGRPVLQVKKGGPILEFPDAESELWRKRLQDAEPHVRRAINAVGRIEVEGLAHFDWVGTGVLVAEDIVATNQHVAHHFAERFKGAPVMRLNTGGKEMRPSIDFLEEEGQSTSQAFRIKEILHLEDDRDPDIALLRVEPEPGQTLPEPLDLFSGTFQPGQQIAAIGYPAFDSRTRHSALVRKLFGDVFDKKRLSPGHVRETRNGLVVHDCSVLNGNSGSALVDLQTGQIVGIHARGDFCVANFAVPAQAVRDHLDRVRPTKHTESRDAWYGGREAYMAPAPQPVASITVPIHVTVKMQSPIPHRN